MKTIAIVAGSQKQYQDYVRNHANLCDRYVCITGVDRLLGNLFDDVRYVGTYQDRTDIAEIRARIDPQVKSRKDGIKQLRKLAKK